MYFLDTLVFLYEVDVWIISIPKPTYKKFENVKKHFLMRFLHFKTQMPCIFLLLELRSLPIKIEDGA